MSEIEDIELNNDGTPTDMKVIDDFEKIQNVLCDELDIAFGGDISSVVFKYCSPFAIVNGDYFFIQFIEAIKPEIEKHINAMSKEELTEVMKAGISQQIAAQYESTIRTQLGTQPVKVLAGLFDAETFTEKEYAEFFELYMPPTHSKSSYEKNLSKLGYVDLESPTAINIYTATFADKDEISALIADYNSKVSEDDKINYTDLVALLMSSITLVINAISYVLIAFVSVSLVVSSIMIGIITYISVLERTKEIGILRAIGASKKDISRIFNAETAIVGFTAGIMGIGVTLILILIANPILHAVTGIGILNASLPVVGAVILVLLSVGLTLIAGLVPSRLAAKKDPVVALRTE
jgi:putative ABC transport system permease protein